MYQPVHLSLSGGSVTTPSPIRDNAGKDIIGSGTRVEYFNLVDDSDEESIVQPDWMTLHTEQVEDCSPIWSDSTACPDSYHMASARRSANVDDPSTPEHLLNLFPYLATDLATPPRLQKPSRRETTRMHHKQLDDCMAQDTKNIVSLHGALNMDDVVREQEAAQAELEQLSSKLHSREMNCAVLRGRVAELEALVLTKEDELQAIATPVKFPVESSDPLSSADEENGDLPPVMQLVDMLTDRLEAAESRQLIGRQQFANAQAQMAKARSLGHSLAEQIAVNHASRHSEISELYLRLSIGSTQLAELHGP